MILVLLFRLRSLDLESSQNGDTRAKKSSMSSRKRQAASRKTGNGINNVAFEDEKGNGRKARKEDGSTEESNHDFNRDSIYRFAVNPLFSGPTDVVEEGEHQTRVDGQRLPFRNTLYLPSSTSYDTGEAEFTFDNQYNIVEQGLPSPANVDEGAHNGSNANEEEVQEEEKSLSAKQEKEATELEVGEIEANKIASEEAREEDETDKEVFIEFQNEKTGFGSEMSDYGIATEKNASSESTILPTMSNANKFEDSASPLEIF